MSSSKKSAPFGFRNMIFFALLVIAGCNQSAPPPVQKGVSPEATSYFKTLLVIGDDRSGSTTDIRKLTQEDYQSLLESIGQKGGGTVAVCLIGNPLPQSREPFILSLQSLTNIQPYNPKDNNLTLTEKGLLKSNNEKAARGNEMILQGQQSVILDYLNNTLNPNVLNYRPSGPDRTDIDDAIARINTLINEPQYKDYEKIIIAFVSDGKNQPVSQIEPIHEIITYKKAELYLVGWETSTDCFAGLTVSNMSSKDGFIEIIKNLIK